MTDFPVRGQKAPAYWDAQLQAYIDERIGSKADTTALALKANDNAVVKLTGNQTVNGTKTFAQPIVVPNDNFAQTKVIGLIDDLAAKSPLSHTHTASQITDASANGRSLLTAANYATMRTLLGLESVPIRFSTGVAAVVATGSDRAGQARTISLARMRVASAPIGSALTVQIQHSSNDGASWSTIAALTMPDGSVTEQVSGALSQSQAVGDLVRINVTSVGLTTAAKGVVVDVFLA